MDIRRDPCRELRDLALTYRVRRNIHGDAIRFGGSATDSSDAAKILCVAVMER